jgi:hypothetical protein
MDSTSAPSVRTVRIACDEKEADDACRERAVRAAHLSGGDQVSGVTLGYLSGEARVFAVELDGKVERWVTDERDATLRMENAACSGHRVTLQRSEPVGVSVRGATVMVAASANPVSDSSRWRVRVYETGALTRCSLRHSLQPLGEVEYVTALGQDPPRIGDAGAVVSAVIDAEASARAPITLEAVLRCTP